MSTVQPAQDDDDFEPQMAELLDQLRDDLCGILDLLHEHSSSALHDTQISKYARQIDALDDFVSDVLDGFAGGQGLDIEALHYQASGLFTVEKGLHGIVDFPVGYIAYFLEMKDSAIDFSACNRAHQAYSNIVTKWEARRGPIPGAEVYAARHQLLDPAENQVLGKRSWQEETPSVDASLAAGRSTQASNFSSSVPLPAFTDDSSAKRPKLLPRRQR